MPHQRSQRIPTREPTQTPANTTVIILTSKQPKTSNQTRSSFRPIHTKRGPLHSRTLRQQGHTPLQHTQRTANRWQVHHQRQVRRYQRNSLPISHLTRITRPRAQELPRHPTLIRSRPRSPNGNRNMYTNNRNRPARILELVQLS